MKFMVIMWLRGRLRNCECRGGLSDLPTFGLTW